MYSTIAVPADCSLQELAKALSTIGLTPTAGRSRIVTFDRAPKRVAVACQEPGCDRAALVTDAAASLCARHWLAVKVPA